MLGDLFLGSIIRGALHARPKPFSRSMNYFGGGIPGIPGFHGGGMNLGMLLGGPASRGARTSTSRTETRAS
jgi:hypothetical protein